MRHVVHEPIFDLKDLPMPRRGLLGCTIPRVCVNGNTGIKNGDGLSYLNAVIVCIIRAIVQKS